jgi:hypothetical protein
MGWNACWPRRSCRVILLVGTAPCSWSLASAWRTVSGTEVETSSEGAIKASKLQN